MGSYHSNLNQDPANMNFRGITPRASFIEIPASRITEPLNTVLPASKPFFTAAANPYVSSCVKISDGFDSDWGNDVCVWGGKGLLSSSLYCFQQLQHETLGMDVTFALLGGCQVQAFRVQRAF